ncbi:serine/threonine-protein kinase [Nonomuraea muscovyensis]|uniref:serine/threonine-protein kinase n=1 Tax=Nonomuraea muscovyensis TaxID=1124761 RepID=UPI0034006EBE
MPEHQTRLLAERYELISPLGRGTMGTVWRAHDRALGREVAVKQIRQDPGLTEEQRTELRERMVREGRLAARISHPAVAAIHDVLIHEGSPWIIMELVEARSLEQVIDEEGPLPPRLVAEIGVDLLGALRAAHAQGITHRDVKPANVLITETGRVVLTDFGIARAEGDSRLTRTGMVIGSPGYTAPERARGDYTGPESDIWSLGATLYFAVEGRPAFERSSIAETLAALLSENADPPTQAGQLRPVLNGLLNKDHKQRLSAAQAETMLRMVADTPTSEMPVITGEALPEQEMSVADARHTPPAVPGAARPAGAPPAAGGPPPPAGQPAGPGSPYGVPAAPPYAGPHPAAAPGGHQQGEPGGRYGGPPRPGPAGPHGPEPVPHGPGALPPGQAPHGPGGLPPGQAPRGPGAFPPGQEPASRGPGSGPGSGPGTVPHARPDAARLPRPADAPGGRPPGDRPGQQGGEEWDPERTVSVMRPKSPMPPPAAPQRPPASPPQPPHDEGAMTTRRVQVHRNPIGSPGQQVYPLPAPPAGHPGARSGPTAPHQAPPGARPPGPQLPYGARPPHEPRPERPDSHGLGTDLFAIAGPEQRPADNRKGLLILAIAAAVAVVMAIVIVAVASSG